MALIDVDDFCSEAPEPLSPIPPKWEDITKTTSRMKVIGGWIVLHKSRRDIEQTYAGIIATSISESMVFIPDPNHEWRIA
ncbi:MAG: hypothetical protein HGA87_01315 [Desulfobulbaceae bacterium]|nr:hypothetical protein [Desulfobulbaceae bacterium]